MTGSVFLVVVIVVAGLLYLLLRRRGGRQSEGIKTVLPAERVRPQEEAPDLKPFRAKANGAPGGLPPKPSAHDSGSSHPAYPVAPAKYSGAKPVKPGSSGQYDVPPISRPDLDPVEEARRAANAPPPAEPWYPQAPASYTEGEDPEADGVRGSSSEGRRPN